MARKMKDSGIEWIGEIPKGWGIYPARYAFSEIRLKNTDGSVKNALKFYNGAIVPKTNFDADSDEYVAETITNYTVVKPDTIMINGLNLNYDLKSLRVGLVKQNGAITSAYLALWPDRSRILPEFANYLFKGYETKMAFHNMGAGIRKTLGFKEFKRQPILIPTIEEQARIASYLDTKCAKIDAVLEQTRNSIEEYKKLKQSVITQAVTKGIHPGRKMKDSGIEWIGEVPESWQILSLGTVTENMRNGYVGPTKDIFHDEGIRYIQSLHIKDGLIDFARREYYVSQKWADTHPKIKENDILIVQTGEIGSVGLVTSEYDGCNCHALIIATPRKEIINPKYLTFYLLSTVGKELLLFHKTGALLPHLNSGKIKFASICVPAIDEQEDIVSYLEEKTARIKRIIYKKEQFFTTLESYKKSLIYECVTGKREV